MGSDFIPFSKCVEEGNELVPVLFTIWFYTLTFLLLLFCFILLNLAPLRSNLYLYSGNEWMNEFLKLNSGLFFLIVTKNDILEKN